MTKAAEPAAASQGCGNASKFVERAIREIRRGAAVLVLRRSFGLDCKNEFGLRRPPRESFNRWLLDRNTALPGTAEKMNHATSLDPMLPTQPIPVGSDEPLTESTGYYSPPESLVTELLDDLPFAIDLSLSQEVAVRDAVQRVAQRLREFAESVDLPDSCGDATDVVTELQDSPTHHSSPDCSSKRSLCLPYPNRKRRRVQTISAAPSCSSNLHFWSVADVVTSRHYTIKWCNAVLGHTTCDENPNSSSIPKTSTEYLSEGVNQYSSRSDLDSFATDTVLSELSYLLSSGRNASVSRWRSHLFTVRILKRPLVMYTLGTKVVDVCRRLEEYSAEFARWISAPIKPLPPTASHDTRDLAVGRLSPKPPTLIVRSQRSCSGFSGEAPNSSDSLFFEFECVCSRDAARVFILPGVDESSNGSPTRKVPDCLPMFSLEIDATLTPVKVSAVKCRELWVRFAKSGGGGKFNYDACNRCGHLPSKSKGEELKTFSDSYTTVIMTNAQPMTEPPRLCSNCFAHFEQAVWLMLFRYETFAGKLENPKEGRGLQSALPLPLMRYLASAHGVSTELFASPLNVSLPLYFSAFPDVDSKFGSLGNAFAANIQEGSYEVNPPFEERLLHRVVVKMYEWLGAAESAKRALSFYFVMPVWDNGPAEYRRALFDHSPSFIRQVVTVEAQKHVYDDCYLHTRTVEDRRAFFEHSPSFMRFLNRPSPCSSALVCMRTSVASQKWNEVNNANEFEGTVKNLWNGTPPTSTLIAADL